MEIQPSFVPAYVNLADLYRMQGRDAEGERLLDSALEISPRDGDVYHALGLLFVRQNRIPEAVSALEKSVMMSPDNPRYSYVYAVALNDTGKKSESIRVLEEAHERHPGDRELLYALINFNREIGDVLSARRYAEKLLEVSPHDPGAARLLDELNMDGNR
jgi:Flp pilus assembly protein TadD